MVQMEKHLSDQLNTVRKDHFHTDKRFRQLVDGIREVVFAAGQQVGKLTDHFTAHNTYLEKLLTIFMPPRRITKILSYSINK